MIGLLWEPRKLRGKAKKLKDAALAALARATVLWSGRGVKPGKSEEERTHDDC